MQCTKIQITLPLYNCKFKLILNQFQDTMNNFKNTNGLTMCASGVFAFSIKHKKLVILQVLKIQGPCETIWMVLGIKSDLIWSRFDDF